MNIPLIREALLENIPALVEGERDVARNYEGMLVSFPDEFSPDAFEEGILQAKQGIARYLVVVEQDKIVAHASFWPMSVRRTSHVLRLDMCVHVGHWRKGYGNALLANLLAWAQDESSAEKVELLVRSTNTAAVALYSKHGFREEGRIEKRIKLGPGRYIDDISMALFLKQT